MSNQWDTGARPDHALDPSHPLRGIWIDGIPAAVAPPARQHAAVLEHLLDRTESEPRRQW